MKYVILIHSNPEPWGHPTDRYTAEGRAQPESYHRAAEQSFDKLMTEISASGELVTGEALGDPSTSTVWRWTPETVTQTDGPYAETKEQLAGFFLIDCATRERAEEIAATFAQPGGTVELRPAMWPGATISRPVPGDDLAEIWRRCTPDVVAALIRRYGDFAAAEDAAQEALLAAAAQWPRDGRPDDPRAWLIRVASRRLVDQIRSDRARVDRERRTALAEVDGEPADHDDSLALLLLCCHPALTPASQVALTLRSVAGLDTGQIARAFLVPETTMGQRISRAKSRLRDLGVGFGVPPVAELPGRVAAVNQVLYLVFTEGHTATTGVGLRDPALTGEAIRLTRRLHECLPADPEVSGLLALMLLTDARRAARLGRDGALVPLPEQDRRRWDHDQIREGVVLIETALPVGPVGPFQLQAAIAAVHAEAATAADTDWAQIEQLYAMLAELSPGPVVTLNRAVAVAMVHGPRAGLELIGPLAADPTMRRSHRLPAVRAHLLDLDGETEAARAAYAEAARLATSIPEQRYLNAKAADLGD